MCAISGVFDQYGPYIPQPNQWPPQTWPPQKLTPQPVVDPNELRELIESFKKAVEAAKTFDRLTGQPDCADPEKAKLEERVADLERRLDAMAEALASDERRER